MKIDNLYSSTKGSIPNDVEPLDEQSVDPRELEGMRTI